MNHSKIFIPPLILIALILISIIKVQAQISQDAHFDRLTSENQVLVKGLSQNWVFTMIQDKYGYIWMGTWDGLNKYNGYEFTIYNEANGLSNHTIRSLFEDRDGNLWVGTSEGLNMMDRKKQMFVRYKLPTDTLNSFRSSITALIQSRDGSVWNGNGAG